MIARGSSVLTATFVTALIAAVAMPGTAIADTPASWWPLDQATGNTVPDASGNGATATTSGDVGWSNGAASFRGTARQQIATTGPVLDTTNDFSVSAWVDPAQLTGWTTFVVQQSNAVSGLYLEYDGDTGKWAFSRSLDDTLQPTVERAESSSPPRTGVWTQLAGVYDRATGAMTLYVNGVVAGHATDRTPIPATGPLVIGRGYTNAAADNLVTGSIAGVQAYSWALSDADIATIHGAGRSGGLVAGRAPTEPPGWQLGLVLGQTFLALLAIGWVLFSRHRRAPKKKDGRFDDLAWYQLGSRDGPVPPSPPAQDDERSLPVRLLLRLGDRVIGSPVRRDRIADNLDLGGIPLRPAEWLLARVGLCVVLSLVLAVLFDRSLFAWVFGVAGGWFGSRFYLSFRVSHRRGTFAEQLPDALQLVAGALQAGFSLPQALDAVVREGTQPMAGEVGRALARTRLGMSVEDALDKAATRMQCTDLTWVVMAIRIQRQVGGNLANLLLNTMHTMRERSQVRRQVQALSAEGKLSAYVLIALPIGLGGWMFLSRPEYVRPLYTTPLGLVMLAVAVGGIVVGWFWMRKMVKVEV